MNVQPRLLGRRRCRGSTGREQHQEDKRGNVTTEARTDGFTESLLLAARPGKINVRDGGPARCEVYIRSDAGMP